MKLHTYLLFLLATCAFTVGFAEEEDSEEYEYNNEDAREELAEILEGDEAEELKAFIRKYMPAETLPMIESAIDKSPGETLYWIYHLYDLIEEYMMFHEKDPAFADTFINFQKHEINTFILSVKIEKRREQGASSSEIEGLRAELNKEIAAAFDLKLKVQAKELEHLKKEVQELEAMLERRKSSKKAVIKRRCKELTGQEEHLEW